ncbi:hypothetical protein [Actinoplanes sp. NBRC 101535]|uniref:hypothetical protein n=1 Tax=Actinoplanes sp. NBRC 101535 TaxID=3032196 RepID=UPI0024A0E02C|nr:hypothetical protein [Actinoplanes sp. NBRC 101535]GLY03007.1 hypothetical protein Acsp01_33860 [Actinoplanes sp. NBRC 101535]
MTRTILRISFENKDIETFEGYELPHLTVHTHDDDLTGHEKALITALTDAVVSVYGDWARPHVGIRLIGLPAGRTGTGGEVDTVPAPAVDFGIRTDALNRPDITEILKRLTQAVTDAIAATLGEHHREQTSVSFTPTTSATTIAEASHPA